MGRVKNLFDELEDQFFLDLMDEIERDKREKRRRELNAQRGYRLAHRIKVVDAFDLWKATGHMRPNFFENDDRYDMVKILYRKKQRLSWILHAMYWRLVYNRPYKECTYKLGTGKFTRFSKLYDKIEAQHIENVKQTRWDEKRTKVRDRRNKKRETKADARRNESLRQLSKLRDSVFPSEPTPILDRDTNDYTDTQEVTRGHLIFTGWD